MEGGWRNGKRFRNMKDPAAQACKDEKGTFVLSLVKLKESSGLGWVGGDAAAKIGGGALV